MKHVCLRIFHRTYAILWRLCRKLHKTVIHAMLPFVARPQAGNLQLKRLGTDYGGWTIPVDVLDGNSICYCVGVGVDASFDVALLEQFQCEVFSFDPTPKAIAYMERLQYDRSKLRFLPIGIWDKDTELSFYAPANAQEVSHSVFDLHGRGECFKASCRKLSSIMQELGHDHIDLLKLDIEGAWRDVIRNIIRERIDISILCAEFDSPVKLTWVLSTIRALEQIGFVLAHYEKDNYLFVKKLLLSPSSAMPPGNR